MDSIEQYREIIHKILQQHASIPYSHGKIESEVIVSQDRNNYLLMCEGWDDDLRIHGCVVHVKVIDGKIWIQRDGIEEGITLEFVAAGIPKDKIVLALRIGLQSGAL